MKVDFMPIKYNRISQRYTARHKGIDLAAPKGREVYAVASGKVVAAGVGVWHSSYGYHVVIKHDFGFTNYAHLSKITVKKGQSVSAGQIIGYCGSTGNSTGPHLHFEIHKGAKPWNRIDPMPYIKGKSIPPYKINKYYELKDTMNVRSGAGLNYKIIGEKKKGEKIRVYDMRTDNTGRVWVRFANGKWICARSKQGGEHI